MTKLNFNTLSYDEGLALVKEAKEAALIKQAEGEGFVDKGKELWATISQFLQDNPGLLRNLGIGAGVGGGLGIASGLMGARKSRRPIRRGIIGALLGVLGGGAVHGGLNLYNIHKKNQSVEGIKDFANKAMQKGIDRDTLITDLQNRTKELGLDISEEDILQAIPSLDKPQSPTEPDAASLSSWLPGASDVPNAVWRGAAGAGVGGIVGSPIHRRWDIERASGEAAIGDGPLNAHISNADKYNTAINKLTKKINKLQKNPNLTTAQQAKLAKHTADIAKYQAKLKAPLAVRDDVATINKFVKDRQGTPHAIASRNWKQWQKPWTGSGRTLRPRFPVAAVKVPTSTGDVPISAVYNRVGRQIPNTSRHSGKGAIGGAALAMLLPEIIRASKGLFVSPTADVTVLDPLLHEMVGN